MFNMYPGFSQYMAQQQPNMAMILQQAGMGTVSAHDAISMIDSIGLALTEGQAMSILHAMPDHELIKLEAILAHRLNAFKLPGIMGLGGMDFGGPVQGGMGFQGPWGGYPQQWYGYPAPQGYGYFPSGDVYGDWESMPFVTQQKMLNRMFGPTKINIID